MMTVAIASNHGKIMVSRTLGILASTQRKPGSMSSNSNDGRIPASQIYATRKCRHPPLVQQARANFNLLAGLLSVGFNSHTGCYGCSSRVFRRTLC